MARTQLTGLQVTDGSIQRSDLDVTTAGSAVIRKVIGGTGITLSSTGPDAGTGDVTVNAAGSNTGSVLVDFGAFPGTDSATVSVTGQTAITSGSIVTVWVAPATTTDHSVDEHILTAPSPFVSAVTAGVGFTIIAIDQDAEASPVSGRGPVTYGKYNLNWRY